MVEALMQKEGHTMIPANMIDVLKVAHHGSKTSTSMEWLSYWKPRNAVISAGVNNAYGHPNEQVLKRIEAYGSRIFRTDLMGRFSSEPRMACWNTAISLYSSCSRNVAIRER